MKSLSLRIWHWLNALIVVLLLTTVFLRQTFFNAKENSFFIKDKLLGAGITIPDDLSKEMARGIRDEMFQWHFKFGLCLAVLFLARIIIGFVDKGNPFRIDWRSYKALHAVFYVPLSVMVITGLTMYFGEGLGLSKNAIHNIKEIHEPLMWFFPVFIVLHIIGVVWAENGNYKGIVSDMINGGENR